MIMGSGWIWSEVAAAHISRLMYRVAPGSICGKLFFRFCPKVPNRDRGRSSSLFTLLPRPLSGFFGGLHRASWRVVNIFHGMGSDCRKNIVITEQKYLSDWRQGYYVKETKYFFLLSGETKNFYDKLFPARTIFQHNYYCLDKFQVHSSLSQVVSLNIFEIPSLSIPLSF